MRLPRFRLRTLMIAVAVAGVAILIGRETLRLRRLSHFYRQKAIEYSRLEAVQRRSSARLAASSAKSLMDAESLRKGRRPEAVPTADMASLDTLQEALREELREAVRQIEKDLFRKLADDKEASAQTDRKLAANATMQAEYLARLRQKYEQADRRPWLELPRDPIDPDSDNIEFVGDWPTPPRVLDFPLMSRPVR